MSPRISGDSVEELKINYENNFEIFQTYINPEKIMKLNQEFKKHEKKGYINYFNFIQSMKLIFDDEKNCNKYDNIYNLFFKRFREIKCIMKNDKEVFYITDYKKEDFISTYNALYALVIFLFAQFKKKLELLFKLTDNDEDGLLNKAQIKYMLITVNNIFCEQMNDLKIKSSILSQSLININVENILAELFEGQGKLNQKLIKNYYYIDFNTFYDSVIKIKNYNYKLIPCFINFKKCLLSKKQEKIIKIKQNIKKDYINISSSFIAEQYQNINKSFRSRKKYTNRKLTDIILPIQYDNEKTFRKSKLSLKSLVKSCSTILDDNNNNNITSFYFNESESEKFNNTSFKNTKFAFQANYSDIKNIEVEPGFIKIISNEEKDEENESNEISSINENIIERKNDKKRLNNKLRKSTILFHESSLNLKKDSNSFNKLRKTIKSNINNTQRIVRPSLYNNLNKKKMNMNLINNNMKNKNVNNNYKTMKEIFDEIKIQKNIFNNGSKNNFRVQMVKESNETDAFMTKYKRSFLYLKKRPKRSSSFCGILYYKSQSDIPQILKKRKK